MVLFRVLVLVCLGFSAPALAASPAPTAYDLDVLYDAEREVLVGEARLTFDRDLAEIGEFGFVLHGELRVAEVGVDGRELDCSQAVELSRENYAMVVTRVRCRAAENDRSRVLHVKYAGPFHRSRARSASDYFHLDADELLLRGPFYSHWFPYFLPEGQLEAMAPPVHAVLRAPAGNHSVMLGEHLGHREEDGRAVDEWRAEGFRYIDFHLSSRPYVRQQTGRVVSYALPDPRSLAGAQRIAAAAGELAERYRQAYRPDDEAAEILYLVELGDFGEIASGNVIGMPSGDWHDFDVSSRHFRLLSHELLHRALRFPVRQDDPLYAVLTEGALSFFDLPIMADMRQDDTYDRVLARLQEQYLENRQAAKEDGGGLPPEKPLLHMTAEDIGTYKDRFVLVDRAPLFWDYLRRDMGRERFDRWVRELLAADALTPSQFYQSLAVRSPGLAEDARVWLETDEYPPRFRR